ncbi:UNVERIFIED_CONTAM: hypothetical protein PYX00_005483 [Menopon gallinae]|uniref:GPI ethanolamine phosphate transferase 1 n=1 Tax=Menopon gallinae TaxID=328185 RepID=A0AAW2HRD3_9NEOP
MATFHLLSFGVLVHIIFLFAVFDIYFKSTVIVGIAPINNTIPPVGKRVVVISADGLRADSLFDKETARIKNLTEYVRGIMEEKGTWGLSESHVPTESRPGHVAMLAGFYEDPSAVTKGDVMEYDNWVFREFKSFLESSADNVKPLLQKSGVLIFLHLLGQDTAGHTHKPHTEKYIENTKNVDRIVREVEKLVNDYYEDDLTSFIFTSDHGMTDWGSHGAGHPNETDTPIVAWGAGISKQATPVNINQADITPLLAVLLGSPIPVNSVGTLPIKFLDIPDNYKAEAMLLNAKQIIAQFKTNLERIKAQIVPLFHSPFEKLTDEELELMTAAVSNQIKNKNYVDAIKKSRVLIELGLEGLEYYQNYYQRLLLISVSSSYVLWTFYLALELYDKPRVVPVGGSWVTKENIALFSVRCLAVAAAAWNNAVVHSNFGEEGELPKFNQFLSWGLLSFSLLLLVIGEPYIIERLDHVFTSFLVPFLLLSISHEGLFIMFLFIHLRSWVFVEYQNSWGGHFEDFRRAYLFLLYVWVSFFGLGNIASLNSFDPAWVRCFLTVFHPFLMSSLILFKTIIPFLIVSCSMRTLTVMLKLRPDQLFIIVLIYCNLMGLNFLYFIKNKGSWLDIGASISHYVIQQVSIVFLLVLYGVAKFLLSFSYSILPEQGKLRRNVKSDSNETRLSLPRYYSSYKFHRS